MMLLSPTFLAILGSILLFGFLLRRRPAFVEVNPHYRELLWENGLDDVGDFLDREAVIISGHPNRHVARLTLGAANFYLKREERVPWTVRLGNAFAGFGFVSLSLREASVLRALPRAGIDGPDWVASGEDRRGRAFLLLHEVPGAVELRILLAEKGDLRSRVELARALGLAVAKVHEAAFDHPDLYAKHVLVDPNSLEIVFLDWQRSRLRRVVALDTRARDLAALNVTIPAELATRGARLACLRAYAAFWECTREETRALARAILARSARLLCRRHVREKLRAPATGQQWIPHEGGTVCVTPAFQRLQPTRPAWLSLDANPPEAGEALTCREVSLGAGRDAVLVRRRARSFVRSLWDTFRLRPTPSPEERQAALLLRLERYGVLAPRVLAMGCRRGRFGRVDSLLLTEAVVGDEALADWVARAWDDTNRRRVLSDVGRLLRRLHEACCHLPDRDFPLTLRRSDDGILLPVLTGADDLLVTRAPSPSLVGRNLTAVEREFRACGATASDLRWLLEGYTLAETPLPAIALEDQQMPADRQPIFAHATGWVDPAVAAAEGVATMPVAVVARPAARAPAPRVSLWSRLFRGNRRLSERADWAEFAGDDWADRIMGVEISDRFHAKQGRSTCRWILHRPGTEGSERRLSVYLKRHYRLSWWRGLLAALWPGGNWSPAFEELEHLEWARSQGVPVPEVVAAAEYIGPWGRFQSVLAVEELAGMLPLHEAVPLAATRLDPQTFRTWKRGLIVEMARLTRLLHDKRHYHKDLYLCHFYIARDDTARVPEWRGKVFLIDLHRLTHHPWTWRVWQTKDLAQLLYSSEVPGIDAGDRLLFWREYRGPDGRGAGAWIRPYVLFRWRRYRRHNARRKAAVAPDPI